MPACIAPRLWSIDAARCRQRIVQILKTGSSELTGMRFSASVSRVMTHKNSNTALDAETSSAGSTASNASSWSATSNASNWSADAQLGAALEYATTSPDAGSDDSPEFNISRLLDRHGPIPEFRDGGSNIDYVHAIMDYVYAAAPFPASGVGIPEVKVISEDSRGFGDLFFGIKIARMLRDSLSEFNSIEVIWAPQPGREVSKLGLGPDTATVKDGQVMSAGKIKDEIIVYGPTAVTGMKSDSYRDKNIVFMSEYGQPDHLPTADKLSSSWRRVPAGARPDEFGLLLEPAGSLDNLRVTEENPQLARHVVEGQYHFAYVNSDHQRALQQILAFHDDKPCPPVVFAGSTKQRKALIAAMNKVAETRNKGKNPVRFEFIDLTNEKESCCYGRNGKTIKVFLQHMTHYQFLATMRSSLPLRIVTGDQSLSEALSLKDSVILYEKLGHKGGLFDSLYDWSGGDLPVFNLLLSDKKDGWNTIENVRYEVGNDRRIPLMASLQEKLTIRHRIVGAVKGYVFRQHAAVRKLDNDITTLAKANSDFKLISLSLKQLHKQLAAGR